MDELVKILGEALHQIGIEADRVWPQIVLVTFIKSLFWSIVSPLLMIASIVGLLKYKKAVSEYITKRKEENKYCNSEEWYGSVILLSVVVVVFSTVLIFTEADSITGVFAPEAKTILDLIKAQR